MHRTPILKWRKCKHKNARQPCSEQIWHLKIKYCVCLRRTPHIVFGEWLGRKWWLCSSKAVVAPLLVVVDCREGFETKWGFLVFNLFVVWLYSWVIKLKNTYQFFFFFKWMDHSSDLASELNYFSNSWSKNNLNIIIKSTRMGD